MSITPFIASERPSMENFNARIEEANLGIAGRAQIETGSYVGTGTYGPSNPNTLTFSFVPKLVFIAADSKGSNYAMDAWMFANPNQKYTSVYGSFFEPTSVTWSGNSMSWYYNGSSGEFEVANNQCNLSGKTYYYFVIS